LGASVFGVDIKAGAFDTENAELLATTDATTPGSTASWHITFKNGVPVGPTVYISAQGGALQYLKVAFVYSVMDTYFKPAQTSNYPSVYEKKTLTPFISALSYSSSYVFTKVSAFNTAVPITQGLTAKKTGAGLTYNQHYMRLPDARYAIYGLTGFSFPRNKNTSCSSNIGVSAVLNNINTYTITTSNSNPSDFWFSADIFTVNVLTLCTPADGTSPFTFITTIGQKNYFTVPTQSIEQYIQEWPVTNVISTAAIDGPNAQISAPTADVWPGSTFAGVSNENTPDALVTGNTLYAGS
jgi:hypothetical protein